MNITTIDLNADLGEGVGDDAAMMDIVSSANIACGGHAGDRESMVSTLRLAIARGVRAGAHPGYPDKPGFGRTEMQMTVAEITQMVAAQIGAIVDAADEAGGNIGYVKPHGALANLAARDEDVAQAIVRAIRGVSQDLSVLAISGTKLETAAGQSNLQVFSEIFADRAYLPNGQLVPRGVEGAVIHDADFAARRLLDYLDSGQMPTADGGALRLRTHSICVHGDTPGAVAMAQRIRMALEDAGVAIRAFLPSQ